MKNMQKKVLVAVAGVLVAIASWLVGNTGVVGSVASTETYYATTTNSTMAFGTAGYSVCKGSCALGSIVVVQPASTGYVRIWNATSTATTTYTTNRSGTFGQSVTQVLSASDVVGTLTVDARFDQGLVVEVASDFNGEYLVTWKK